ncbi:hypothetical protein CCC_02254 [Paramagnetospirillum magnetotacticum MS-1]|uniref:Glycosyltransferase n=1 Tax=Paramagnetospirillum magnetotacticum MS-1 TaxID=272627 RepID=A0A0C2YGA6_PARME|nr:hypothetical protein [Paramagnetospirillum magnetotacticum]KIL98804.1 hypothetical protein CCC_02254 [Paramagnetospirillum magnetotacticum MS-1]
MLLPETSKHLWLALSPHGYGHAAMTAPVIHALRRRLPDLRLTIQTALPRAFLEERYGPDFTHIPDIPDFGLKMLSATVVDLEASAEGYRRLHADFDALVESEAQRLRRAWPDLVLANVPYVTLAAAARAGIGAVALSSLEWADIYRHYLGDRPEAAGIYAQMRGSYNAAQAFLRVTPAMDMPSIDTIIDIGPVANKGRNRRDELAARLPGRLGLAAFGGIDHDFSMANWPRMEGWTWATTLDFPKDRGDIVAWRDLGLPFSDLAASVDVIVTKPGYGTFTEAGLSGIPVLYVLRPDWPESPAMDIWLAAHTRALAVTLEALTCDAEAQLRRLFSLPEQPVAQALGNEEAAEYIASILCAETGICERS